MLSRAHEGNRVLVDAVSFFRTDAEIADRFAFALQNGRRLRVCLEGAEGTGKVAEEKKKMDQSLVFFFT